MPQQLATFRELIITMARGFPYRLKIAEIGKHSANMIKLTCHGTGSRIVTMLYPFQLAHLTSPTMSPFQVLLHIRAFTAWMVAVFFSEFLDAFVKIHKRLAAFLLRTEHLMLEFATFVLLQITQTHPQTHEFFEIAEFTLESLLVSFQSLA